MRLARRNEILLNAQMDLQGSAFKPAAAARGKLRRLHLFHEPEDALIERPRLVFPASWHCNQNVIDTANWHLTPLEKSRRRASGPIINPVQSERTRSPANLSRKREYCRNGPKFLARQAKEISNSEHGDFTSRKKPTNGAPFNAFAKQRTLPQEQAILSAEIEIVAMSALSPKADIREWLRNVR